MAKRRDPGSFETGELAEAVKEKMNYDIETGNVIWRDIKGVHPSMRGLVAGSRIKYYDGYYAIRIGIVALGEKFIIGAHRIAWLLHYGNWPDGNIDHIDGNAENNRIENLRVASHAENNKNKSISKLNTSGFVGVSWHNKLEKWMAYITSEGVRLHLGYFDEISDAVNARKSAEKKHGFHENHGRQK